jgi:hypothetical protein
MVPSDLVAADHGWVTAQHGEASAGRSRAHDLRMSASRVRRVLGAALVGGLVLAGSVACSSFDQPKPKPKPHAAPTHSASATPTPKPTPLYWPLTGVATPTLTARPALAVKIENSITARPQTGLNSADMVWEEVVEGGITRYLAMYQSTLPPEIGPVRSTRPMDPAIAGPLHGVFAFSGGQPQYVSAAAQAGLQIVSNDAGAPGFYRISSRPAPHNVYADPAKLLGQADAAHRASPPPQFLFATTAQQPTALTAGKPANVLHLVLSGIAHPSWTWNAPAGKWLRSEFDTPAVGADGKQLAATNVVVLRVNVVITTAVDPAGNRVPETLLAGTGSATVATGGHVVAGSWAKPSVTAPVQLAGPDGMPLRLAPGNTWVELVPNGTGGVALG